MFLIQVIILSNIKLDEIREIMLPSVVITFGDMVDLRHQNSN